MLFNPELRNKHSKLSVEVRVPTESGVSRAQPKRRDSSNPKSFGSPCVQQPCHLTYSKQIFHGDQIRLEAAFHKVHRAPRDPADCCGEAIGA